ncbi:MAG: hypothetical protein WCO23_04505 [bacterium]
MNAAKILINKSGAEGYEIVALQDDYINTSNLTSLEPSLYGGQAKECKLQILNIGEGNVTVKSIGLSDQGGKSSFDFELHLGSILCLTDNDNKINYEISLISTKVDDHFYGPEF